MVRKFFRKFKSGSKKKMSQEEPKKRSTPHKVLTAEGWRRKMLKKAKRSG